MVLGASTVVVESCVEVSRYGAYAHKPQTEHLAQRNNK